MTDIERAATADSNGLAESEHLAELGAEVVVVDLAPPVRG